MVEVSVIIPSYNHANYIEEAIRSSLDQSHPSFEVIVRDDASTDETFRILSRISDPRLRVILGHNNVGASANMNLAIAASRGKYIAMLNSDDIMSHGRLALQSEYLNDHPETGLVFGKPRVVHVDRDSGKVSRDQGIGSFATTIPDSHGLLRHFFFNGNILCHPSVMIRRQVYKTVGLYDQRLAQLPDFDLWIRAAFSWKIDLIDHECVTFRVFNDSSNASAPSAENLARDSWENVKVRRRFRSMTDQDAQKIFPNHYIEGNIGDTLVMAALEGAQSYHRHFAAEVLYDSYNQHALPDLDDLSCALSSGQELVTGCWDHLHRLTGTTGLSNG